MVGCYWFVMKISFFVDNFLIILLLCMNIKCKIVKSYLLLLYFIGIRYFNV